MSGPPATILCKANDTEKRNRALFNGEVWNEMLCSYLVRGKTGGKSTWMRSSTCACHDGQLPTSRLTDNVGPMICAVSR